MNLGNQYTFVVITYSYSGLFVMAKTGQQILNGFVAENKEDYIVYKSAWLSYMETT